MLQDINLAGFPSSTSTVQMVTFNEVALKVDNGLIVCPVHTFVGADKKCY